MNLNSKDEQCHRVEFLRLLLAQAGVQYLAGIQYHDRFEPPVLEVDGNRVESPLNIANYIADKYGLGRHTQDNKARAEVIVRECLDFINKGRRTRRWRQIFTRLGDYLSKKYRCRKFDIQGDTSRLSKPVVDINLKVVFEYKVLILKCNFHININRRFRQT